MFKLKTPEPSKVTVFGDRAFKKVIKSKYSPRGGPQSNLPDVLIKEVV